ncbi:putative TIR domain, P-loop containing nucleoside triphosphate hydrolase [Medicago truncatula]|nr:disease resistance protein RPV1 [Medicago truncatula]XP_024632314.1 disease resistance protein RPV1 [Medicago truncatula]AES65290.1 disease resistance protein (TIR-NBS-LRR class), putative [Medicago truncatula]RHN73442.1 putative TIR domain, P-loop containing nucleoside triphosphate hydrolase [Medicago truncatula]
MAMQINIGASSSSTLEVASNSFDVFISFRGDDTRRKFTSHLNEALKKSGLKTFIDDNELKKGDEISSALIKAIEESCASIVILSENYASSKWCLNELVKILECKKDNGQIVIPIFYEIDPSHVRYQIGSYGQAFAKYEKNLRHKKDNLQKWKDALTEVSKLSGWDSKNSRIESDFIKDIVKDVLEKLNHGRPFEANKELVGIEEKYEEIELLTNNGSNDVRTLGLWGMGGIGKTALAKSLYGNYCSQFEYHCFLENVREESTRCGLNVVRKKLFSTLLKLGLDAPYFETPTFKKRLERAKCLIVLDDVATLEQAENLKIGLGLGSRVIVTTRDRKICHQFEGFVVYEVKELNEDESLQLFCCNAFQEKHAKEGYEELSKSAIGYCRGNPLALKVLGANFRAKSKEACESELEKIKEIPYAGIHDVLKLSFYDLDRTQRDIFLDIACFFYPKINHFYCYGRREYIIDLFNACKFYPATSIEVLLHKSLMTFGYRDQIEMHDLVVEMGREIVKQEAPKDPGKRSRLWDPELIYEVFKYNKGTDAVEVILFDTSKIGDVYLSSRSFESMINLRLLHIANECNNVHLQEGLEWLSDKLRYLHWESFPLESLPSTFCAQNLVQLSMTHSKLRKLWDRIQKLDNLTIIKLDNSEDLIEIPDLSRAPNLKILSLAYCVSLHQLHPSIFSAPKLRELCLKGCKKIESLVTDIHSKSLQRLDLTDCSSLVQFCVTSEEMKWLSLRGTTIHEFSSLMLRNSKLDYLDLGDCKKLNFVGKKLSNDRGLESLSILNLSGCTQINTLSMSFILDSARFLKYLNLRNCCNLETLPDNIQNCLMLRSLHLDGCINLNSLPKLPASLEELSAINCTYLDTNSIQREMLENMLYRLRTGNHFGSPFISPEGFFNLLLPVAEVPCGFDFFTTEASIIIPPISKYEFYHIVLCVFLSEGLNLTSSGVNCTIYNHGDRSGGWNISFEHVSGAMISDHVMLFSSSGGIYHQTRADNDHYRLSFEVELYGKDWEQLSSTKGIKGCGVILVSSLEHYCLRLDGSSSRSKVEIVELPFNAQVSDEFDQHSNIDDDENEDAQQQLLITPKENEEDLNYKSSCDCSIGLLLQQLLEVSKRLFLLCVKLNDKTKS